MKHSQAGVRRPELRCLVTKSRDGLLQAIAAGKNVQRAVTVYTKALTQYRLAVYDEVFESGQEFPNT